MLPTLPSSSLRTIMSVMGQIWDRINRLVRSYSLQESSSEFQRSSRAYVESDEEKLRRMIEELESGKRTRQPHLAHTVPQRKTPHDIEQETRRRIELKRALEILGLPTSATPEQIKNTYKKLMMQYHPDRVMQLSSAEQALAKEMSARLNQAYQFLKETLKL